MSVTVPETGPSSHSSDLLNRFVVNPMQTFTPKAKANKDITCKSKTAKWANCAKSRTLEQRALRLKGQRWSSVHLSSPALQFPSLEQQLTASPLESNTNQKGFMNKTSLSEAETLLFVGTYSGETGYSSSKSKHTPLLSYLVRVDAALLSHTREFLKSLRGTVAFSL